jgi:hypothetical protein
MSLAAGTAPTTIELRITFFARNAAIPIVVGLGYEKGGATVDVIARR